MRERDRILETIGEIQRILDDVLIKWDWPPRWSPSVPWNWAARDEWPKGGYYLEVRSL